MTTPDSHRDTYAESFHREFFKNFSQGILPKDCAGEEGHDTASVGGFVMMAVVAVFHHSDRKTGIANAMLQMQLTHKSKSMDKSSLSYLNLLFDIIEQNPTPEALRKLIYTHAQQDLKLDIQSLVNSNKSDRDVIGRVFSSACYITDSYPSIMYLAAKYADSYEEALIANVNVGGECCHRGAALGVIMGLASGMNAIPKRWIDGLVARDEIQKEVEQAITAKTLMRAEL